MNEPRFGTAGLADSYTVKKFDPAAIAAYTAGFGLTAFEYQCGRGVRLAHDKAHALGEACAARGIALSVHAPYYISMSSLEEDKRLHSIDYLLQSCALVKALGGKRVIFHSGSCGKQSREEALEKALDTMERAVKACDEAGYGDCILCPETMGKVNQLGTLDEVLALCGVDERITPCIDFGHLYARSLGTQFAEGTAAADYAALLDTLQAGLGDERAKAVPRPFLPHRLHQGRRKVPPDLCRYRVRPAPCTTAGTAERARADPHHHLRKCGHPGRGCGGTSENLCRVIRG